MENVTDKKYYEDQLKKVNVDSEYRPLIVISSPPGGLSTNYLTLTKECAEIMVKWLNDNFINK